ncbi:MAG: TonB-dependent siderophore receptor [Chitinophagaceae bacterium]
MKKYFFVMLGVIHAVLSFASDPLGKGVVAGEVLTSNGQPAGAVTVTVKGTGRSTYTSENGKFILKNVPEGEQELEVSLIGYETVVKQVKVEASVTVNVTIQLSISDVQLEEVIVKARRTGYIQTQPSSSLRITQPLLDVPQNIQVVTGSMLADQQVISMSDGLIRNVSGATRLEHWGDLYANITMRGSQIQAFRNGFNVVSSYWGPLTEDMSFVDHIEFVKGPAGFMLANGDPSGLYNIVTKKPTGQTKGEATFTMGSFDLYRMALDLDGKLSKDGKLLYRLNMAAQNKKSHRLYEHNNRYSFAPVISYQLDEKTTLTAEYNYQRADMSDVGSYYVFSRDGYGTLPLEFTSMPPGLPATKIDDHSIYLNMQHHLNADWKLTAQVAHFDYRQQGSSMWPGSVAANGDMIRGVGIWDAKSKMNLAQAFINGNVATGELTHSILAGLDMGNKEYWADWSTSHALDTAGAAFNIHDPYYGVPVNGYPAFNRSIDLETRAVMGGGLMDQRYTGIYVQDAIGLLNNKLRVTLAGRYTYVRQSAWGGAAISAKHFTPRVGLSYSINNNTSVYALYDQAFVPQGGRLTSGKDVQPITGNNTEFGIKKEWAGGKWNSTLSLYRILKNNELTADPTQSPTSGLSVELGQKKAQGVEFDIKGTLARGLNLVANYAFTEAVVSKVAEGVTAYEVGEIVPGYSKHTVNSWISYKVQDGPLKGAGISGGFTWLLDRATDTWSKTTPDQQRLPDYFKLDGGVFWEKDKVRLTLNVFNILDEYLYSGSYYEWLSAYYWQTEPPRNFRFSIGYRF